MSCNSMTSSHVLRMRVPGIWFLAFAILCCSRMMDAHQVFLDTKGHTEQISKLLFTKDEKQIISCSADKSIRIWDVATGRNVRTLWGNAGPEDEGAVFAMALSPDNRLLAAAGRIPHKFKQGTYSLIKIYDFDSGYVIKAFAAHTTDINALTFSADGRLLVSASADHKVKVWSVKNNYRLANIFHGHTEPVQGISITGNGRYIATCGNDRKMIVWDLKNSTISGSRDNAHSLEIKRILFSPNGRLLATASYDGTIKLWEAETFTVLRTIKVPDGFAQEIQFSPDGKYLVYGGICQEIYRNKYYFPLYIYDIMNGKIREKIHLHDNTISSIAISGSGALISSSGGGKNEIFIHNTSHYRTVRTLAGNGAAVTAVHYSPQEKSLQFGLFRWNRPYKTYGELECSLSLKDLQIKALPDYLEKKVVYPTSRYGVFRYQLAWKNNTFQLGNRSLSLPFPGERIRNHTFTPDGKHLFVAADYGLYQYCVRTGQLVKQYRGHNSAVRSVSLSPDGRYLFSGSDDQTIKIWKTDMTFGKREFYGGNSQEKMKQYQSLLDMGHQHAEGMVTNRPYSLPLASLFVSAKGDFVIWTPEGYFAGNPILFDNIGFFRRNGPMDEGDYLPMSQFVLALNRPDLVLEKLGFSEKKTRRQYKMEHSRLLQKYGIHNPKLDKDLHAPVLAASGTVSTGKSLLLVANCTDRKYGLVGLLVTRNGTETGDQEKYRIPGRPGQYTMNLAIPLEKGENRIGIRVMNGSGILSREIVLQVQGQ